MPGSKPRPRRLLAGLLAASLALVANDCFKLWEPIVRVGAPADGASLTHMPLTIELEMLVLADPSTLVVRLNGIDISDRFTVDPPIGSHRTAWADFVWGAAFVLPGTNLLEVEVDMHRLPYANQLSFDMEGDCYADSVSREG